MSRALSGTGCQFILTVGYQLADATIEEAKANPEVHFAIVDEQVEGDNIKPIVFDTHRHRSWPVTSRPA
jgi:basic membrane protein A